MSRKTHATEPSLRPQQHSPESRTAATKVRPGEDIPSSPAPDALPRQRNDDCTAPRASHEHTFHFVARRRGRAALRRGGVLGRHTPARHHADRVHDSARDGSGTNPRASSRRRCVDRRDDGACGSSPKSDGGTTKVILTGVYENTVRGMRREIDVQLPAVVLHSFATVNRFPADRRLTFSQETQ